MSNIEVLPNTDSVFPDGHAIVSDKPLPTYCGHLRKADEAFPGKWVYPFPSEVGARRALARIQKTIADRAPVK